MERTTIRPEAEPIALIIWRFRLHRETRPPSIHIFPCPSSPPDVFTNLSCEFNSDGRGRGATCTAELMKGKTKISHRSHAGGNHGSTLELFWELYLGKLPDIAHKDFLYGTLLPSQFALISNCISAHQRGRGRQSELSGHCFKETSRL